MTLAIPCRDAAPHLRPLLKSLLAQTEQDFRLLLVDDGSRDDSVEVARAVAGDRVELLRNETPLGIGGNWNLCAARVETEFFCLAHQDDLYAPDFLARMLDALTENPEAGMAHCRAEAIDGDGAPFKSSAELYKMHFWQSTPCGDRRGHYARLWRGNYVCCPSVVYRTEAFRRTGAFATELRFALDWEYWFRLLRAGYGIIDVDAVLLQYRRHATAATRAATLEHWRFAEELKVLHEARDTGVSAGLLPATAVASPALRNILLHEALTDLERGDRQAVAHKLDFVREHATEIWNDPLVRAFRTLRFFGLPGRALLQFGRSLAVRYGLGSGAGTP